MAYEKQTWECGETITADKLNHMEDGIANAGGGGDCGFECTETRTPLTEESVTTVAEGPFCGGELSYSQIINAETIFVTFNGTEYECARIDDGTGNYAYGGIGQQGPDFSEYPFAITLLGGSETLFTETVGTYAIKIEAVEETIITTSCFEKAVKSAITAPLRLIPNVTTKAEAVEAFNKGLMMYFINTDSSPNHYELITTFSPESGIMSSTPATNILNIGFSEEDDTFYYTIR